MADVLEDLRRASRAAFENYKNEAAQTEALITQLPKRPAGGDLTRLLARQSKEREAFEHYQRTRRQYVDQALAQMSGKEAKRPPETT